MSKFYTKLNLGNEIEGDKVLKSNADGIIEEASLTDEQLEATSVINNTGDGSKFLANDGTYKESVTIVNDLTTGGEDKVLSAEMGKTIKAQLDDIEGGIETANQIALDILGE